MLLQILRRNPDAIALAVLCLLLGLTAPSATFRSFAARPPARIQRLLVAPRPPAALGHFRLKLPPLPPCISAPKL